MLLGELIGTNPFCVNVKEVRRLMKFWFVLGDDRSCQDHAGPILR